MGRVRASSACWLLWPAMVVLLVLASSIQPATATPRDIFYSRTLQQTAGTFPQCLGDLRCSAVKNCTALCPDTHDCVVYDSQSEKSICTNTLRPPVEIASMFPVPAFNFTDNDLCTGWTTSGAGATPIGPMFGGGDCTNPRQGYVYAIYDCSAKKVCLKATSCVGKTSFPEGPKSTNITGFLCPGVTCGCYNSTQAQNECGVVGTDIGNNWYMLKQVCGDKDKTENNLNTATTQGVQSGWETCYTASENTTYSLQAHFNIGTDTIDNQQANKPDHGLIFKTPTCPSTPPCTSNPQLSLDGVSTSVCASGATAQVVFSYANSQDIKVPTTSDLTVELLQDDGTTAATGVAVDGDPAIDTVAKTITVTIAPTTGTFAQSNTSLAKVRLTVSVMDTCDTTELTATSAINIVLAPFLDILSPRTNRVR